MTNEIQPVNESITLSEEEVNEIYMSSQSDTLAGLTLPTISINHHKDYIEWGKGNNFPDKLIDLKRNSSLHGAILFNKKMQVAGKGATYDIEGKKAKKTAKFIEDINSEGEDVNDIINKITSDFELLGSYALLVTYSNDWKSINTVEHMEMNKIRCAKPNQFGQIEGYFYSFDWNSYRPKKAFIPKFDTKYSKYQASEREAILKKWEENEDLSNDEKALLEDKNRTQLLVYKPYEQNTFFYSLPSYIGGVSAIETDVESDVYALSALKNGFDISYHMIIKNFDTDKAAQKAYLKSFYARVKGTRKAKVPLVSFVKDDASAPTIEKLDAPDLNKSYTAINENVIQKIITAHRLTHPLLAGIQVAGKLGNSAELEKAYNIYYSSVIQPDQFHITKGLNRIMKFNDLEVLSIEKLNPFFTDKDEEDVDGQVEGNNTEIADEDAIEENKNNQE